MATGSTQPFTPAINLTIAATTASASAATNINPVMSGPDTVLIYNSSAAVAFIAFGAGSAAPVASAANGFAVPPGGTRLVYVGPTVNQVAAILAAGAGNVYVSVGTGTIY